MLKKDEILPENTHITTKKYIYALIQGKITSTWHSSKRHTGLERYQAAVINSGHSDLYRLYVAPTGGHIDQPILDTVPSHLMELISWSDNLD